MVDNDDIDVLIETVSDMISEEFESLTDMFERLVNIVAEDRERIKKLETELEYFKTRLSYLVNKESYH